MLYYPLEKINLFWNEIVGKNDFLDRLKDLALDDSLGLNAWAILGNRFLC